MSASSRSSIRAGSATGQLARWTLSGVEVPPGHQVPVGASATNGMNGATRRVTVVRQVYRVAYAARLSASSSAFQNRRRFRHVPVGQLLHEPLDLQVGPWMS